MYDLHLKLQQAQADIRLLQGDAAHSSEMLERERATKDRLKQEVETYNERQAHVDNVRNLKMKRTLLVSDCKILMCVLMCTRRISLCAVDVHPPHLVV